MLPQSIALAATVLTLTSLTFFVLGSIPLLILKHDVAMDSKFIRQLFHHCYRLVAFISACGALGYGLSGRPLWALGLAAVCALALGMRRAVLARMDALRPAMIDGDARAIRRFRQVHVTGIAVNLAQLLAIGLTIGKTGL